MYNLCHNNRTVVQFQPDPKSSIDRPSNTEVDQCAPPPPPIPSGSKEQ